MILTSQAAGGRRYIAVSIPLSVLGSVAILLVLG
jgi:hypothetical protein